MKLNIFAITILKLDSNHTFLAVITWILLSNKDGNYFPQVFLKQCKYLEKKVVSNIQDNYFLFNTNFITF